MAGKHALTAKIHWEAVEKQWMATTGACREQATRLFNAMASLNSATRTNVTAREMVTTGTNLTAGVLATQDWDDNGVNGPLPPALDRPLTVISPDPDAVINTYPAIRRGFWSHGGFPLDDSFGDQGDKMDPTRHSGLYRTSDRKKSSRP